MINTFKTLIPLSVLLALTGCGGSDNDNSPNSTNRAPTFNAETLVTTLPSLAAERGGDALRSSTEIVADVPQWNVTFYEDEKAFDNPDTISGVSDYVDIDLLAGVTDADNDKLSVQNLTFLWSGPNCANTLVDGVRFPEVCAEIYAELGLEAGVVATADEARQIRELQNKPVVDDPIYGFEILSDAMRVTPSNFAQILRTTQTAELGINYEVTDGEFVIVRKLFVRITGVDYAPEFIQLNSDGTPFLDADGNKKPVELDSVLVSEKFNSLQVDIAEGFFDQDILDAADRVEKVGDLNDYYSIGNTAYTRETLAPTNLQVKDSEGNLIDAELGFTSGPVRLINPQTGNMSSAILTLNPGAFTESLSAGDIETLTVSFELSDGNNSTERSFEVVVVGADAGNNAPVFFDNITSEMGSTDAPTSVSLLAGTLEHEGDAISVVNLTPVDGTQSNYGIFINANNIVVDPYFFTHLQPNETQTFKYEYQLSDGSLESSTRAVEIVVTGQSANLAARGEESDPGFETGSLDSSAWRFQAVAEAAPENLTVTDTEAHSGTYSLSGTQNGIYATLGEAGIQQNVIDQNDLVYLKAFTQVSAAPWNAMSVLVNRGDDFDLNLTVQDISLPALGVANNWVERVSTYRAPEYFDPEANETFNVTFLMPENSQIDDVALIKVVNGWTTRRMIADGTFNTPATQGWSVTGGASLDVTLDANRAVNPNGPAYGLHVINNTGEVQRLELDPSLFPQGSIKKGMRYIIQLDIQVPSYTTETGAVPIDFGIHEVGGSNISRSIQFADRSNTLWKTYYAHIDTTSDGVYFGGPLNTDVDFDWENATVQPALYIRAGDELQIDNIIMYPVPKH